MLLENLTKYYKPGTDLTADKQLVATHGRCSFWQYILSKPGKCGIKIFWCCDSTALFLLRGEVYVRRQIPVAIYPGVAFGANNI